MREKLVDSILLAALVIVCIIIMYTLFFPSAAPWRSGGASPARPLASQVAQPEAVEVGDAEAEVAPVVPSQGAQEGSEEAEAGEIEVVEITDAESTEVEPAEVESADAPETSQEALEATAEDSAEEVEGAVESAIEDVVAGAEAEETSEAPATPSAPLPEGAFALERVGFSFATGGVGACSVVLEPWRHAAVSPDILEQYGCGSEITVSLEEGVAGRESATLIVADTMPPSNSRTVNIYVAPDEPAFEYGVQTGRLEPSEDAAN